MSFYLLSFSRSLFPRTCSLFSRSRFASPRFLLALPPALALLSAILALLPALTPSTQLLPTLAPLSVLPIFVCTFHLDC